MPVGRTHIFPTQAPNLDLNPDGHKSHFRRYYIGPSPVSSSSAAGRTSRAIKEDADVHSDPVGWSVLGNDEQFILRSGQGRYNDTDTRRRGRNVSLSFQEPFASGSASQDQTDTHKTTSPLSRTTPIPTIDEEHSQSRSINEDHSKLKPQSKSIPTIDEEHSQSRSRSVRKERSQSSIQDLSTTHNSNLPSPPVRSSTPPKSADNKQASILHTQSSSFDHGLSPNGNKRRIQLREIPSIQSLRHPQQQQSQDSHTHTNANTYSNGNADTGDLTARDGIPSHATDVTIPSHAADVTIPSHAADVTIDAPTHPPSTSRRAHHRDISRQSRMSRASTAGTFASQDSSFGTQQQKQRRQKRLNKLFPWRKKKRRLRQTNSITPINNIQGYTHTQQQQPISGGVAPGYVGTSQGGTKWVGQSFEVGQRFKWVLDHHQRLQEEEETEDNDIGLPRIITTNDDDPPSPKSAPARDEDKRSMSRSPSDVLTAFARDASLTAAAENQQQQRDKDNQQAKEPIQSTDPPAASIKPGRRLSTPASPVSTLARPSLLLSPSKKRTLSITSLDPTTIESRHGWTDIASRMTAQSAHHDTLHQSIIDRAEGRFKLHTMLGNLGIDTDKKSANRVPPIQKMDVETPATLPFKTPFEEFPADSNGITDSYFVTSPVQDQDSSGNDGKGASDRDAKRASDNDAKGAHSQPRLCEALDLQSTVTTPSLAITSARASARANRVDSDTTAVPSTAVDLLDEKSNDNEEGLGQKRSIKDIVDESHNDDIASRDSMRHKQPSGSVVDESRNGNRLSSDDRLGHKKSTGSIVEHPERPNGMTTAALNNSFLQPTPRPKKTVQFDKSTTNTNTKASASPSGDTAPAPPHVVLARPQPGHPTPPKEYHDTSPSERDPFITRSSLLRRDRMLVKNDWTPAENVPQDLDENQARALSIHPGQWREYTVVLRPGRVELWDEPSFTDRLFSGKAADQLHLAFVIPLAKGHTFLSILSQIDRIFCLTYAQSHASTHVSGGGKRKVLNLRKSGTNILLFQARSLTMGSDWIWDIWRETGASIPESVEVHLPYVGLRVKFPIPEEMPQDHQVDYDDDGEVLKKGLGALAVPSPEDEPLSKDLVASNSSSLGGEGYKMTTRPRVVGTILRLLRSVPDFEAVLQSGIARGMRFELAWRRGANIDWVLHDRTLEDQTRYWSILCGSILKEARHPGVLEFRKAEHYPTSVTLGNGKEMDEPPAVEGFLWRVRPVSGALSRIYVSAHDSHVFVSRPGKAYPPDRHLAVGAEQLRRASAPAAILEGDQERQDTVGSLPGRSLTQPPPSMSAPTPARRRPGGSTVDSVAEERQRPLATKRSASALGRDDSSASMLRRQQPFSLVDDGPEELADQWTSFKDAERLRQFNQISNADGYIDLKDIHMIKYLGDDDDQKGAARDGDDEADGPNRSGRQGDIDVGGEEGLTGEAPAGVTASDHRMYLRRRRQFEVIMSNGRQTRFEAYSQSVAQEWITRLEALATYWKRREKVDALEKMEVSGFDPALIRRRMQRDANAFERMTMGGGDIDPASPSLGHIWNWCTILGCRGIILCGRLFVKKHSSGPFFSRYYVLINGRLLCYKLVTSTRTARNRQNAGIFHKRSNDLCISIKDSYTFSGKLTESLLKNSQTEGANPSSLGEFASGGVVNTMSFGGRHKLPRVYSDGLLSIDEDEDCTFVLRYRTSPDNSGNTGGNATTTGGRGKARSRSNSFIPHTHHTRHRSSMDDNASGLTGAGTGGAQRLRTQSQTAPAPAPSQRRPSTGDAPPSSSSIPSLNDNSYSLLVFRARSKLERDLWIRAIHHERERLTRVDVNRELGIRNRGQCPYKRDI
ncbi:unnamed protein product [Sympodiomycopsis kandeliae]